jgi:hypothetical protein
MCSQQRRQANHVQEYRDLRKWIAKINDAGELCAVERLLDGIGKDERKTKLEPLCRFINHQSGIRSWVEHWKKNDAKRRQPDDLYLRDPSTRMAYFTKANPDKNREAQYPMKIFILSNIQYLTPPAGKDFTPQQYLHALGYDNGGWGRGICDPSILKYHKGKDVVIQEQTGQLKSNGKKRSKTEAKQDFNKGLYSRLPSARVTYQVSVEEDPDWVSLILELFAPAATRIQAAWRGYWARTCLCEGREEQTEAESESEVAGMITRHHLLAPHICRISSARAIVAIAAALALWRMWWVHRTIGLV